jgi:hypothetical protein
VILISKILVDLADLDLGTGGQSYSLYTAHNARKESQVEVYVMDYLGSGSGL